MADPRDFANLRVIDHLEELHRVFKDSEMHDAYGRFRVSNPETVFDNTFSYDKQPLAWFEATSGTASSSHVASKSAVSMTTGTDAGDQIIRQTKRYHHYQPGKSQLIFMSCADFNLNSNNRARIGYFDGENGVFFQCRGSTASWVIRSKTSGSVVNTTVDQTDWNLDKFDGSGLNTPSQFNRSGRTLDFTKIQLIVIDLEWLSAGRVRVGYMCDGHPCYAHEFKVDNALDAPYMTTADLPLRYELTNVDGGTADTITTICSMVASEGGVKEDFAIPFAVSNGVTQINVTTRRALLSIRPKATFNSVVNRMLIILRHFHIYPESNAVFYEIIHNGTLGGTPSWASVNSNSGVEYDVAGTTVTGGQPIDAGFAAAGSPGSKTFSIVETQNLVSRLPLVVDIAGANPEHISLVGTSISGVQAEVLGEFNWGEIR